MTTQRPTLTADPDWLRDARDAVDRFVAGLQAGIDTADAQTYNADFADDVMWGSPYGATVNGYDTLHSIHRRMFGTGAWSWLPKSSEPPMLKFSSAVLVQSPNGRQLM